MLSVVRRPTHLVKSWPVVLEYSSSSSPGRAGPTFLLRLAFVDIRCFPHQGFCPWTLPDLRGMPEDRAGDRNHLLV